MNAVLQVGQPNRGPDLAGFCSPQ